jgi:hypothetical protein
MFSNKCQIGLVGWLILEASLHELRRLLHAPEPLALRLGTEHGQAQHQPDTHGKQHHHQRNGAQDPASTFQGHGDSSGCVMVFCATPERAHAAGRHLT